MDSTEEGWAVLFVSAACDAGEHEGAACECGVSGAVGEWEVGGQCGGVGLVDGGADASAEGGGAGGEDAGGVDV